MLQKKNDIIIVIQIFFHLQIIKLDIKKSNSIFYDNLFLQTLIMYMLCYEYNIKRVSYHYFYLLVSCKQQIIGS